MIWVGGVRDRGFKGFDGDWSAVGTMRSAAGRPKPQRFGELPDTAASGLLATMLTGT
jgi:hypothetical protein